MPDVACMNSGTFRSEKVNISQTDDFALHPTLPSPQPGAGDRDGTAAPHRRNVMFVRMCCWPVSYHSNPTPSSSRSLEAAVFALVSHPLHGSSSGSPERHATRALLIWKTPNTEAESAKSYAE
eukprot:scaffold108019_cov28-Tisochrysis_lutea.AAC.3